MLLALLTAGAVARAQSAGPDRPAGVSDPISARPALCPPPPSPPQPSIEPPTRPGSTRATADRAVREDAVTVLEGRAEILDPERFAGAEHIRFNQATQRADLSRNVFLTTDELLVNAERGTIDLDSGASRFDEGRYDALGIGAQGGARQISRDAEDVTRLDQATFSTCPRQQEDWFLAAGRVTLDPATRQGRARNVTLWFRGVPMFYSPWLAFPLGEERMSGFLAPSIGTSTSSGLEVATPWYWNAAPNFDATLTPVYLQRRGGQLRSQWRWLNRQGSWQIDNEYLPDDREYGDTRSLTQLQHNGRLGSDWSTSIDASTASDEAYFDDLGDELSLTSQTHLLRRADLDWRSGPASFRARAQTYQTLDEEIPSDRRPYKQLPQLTFDVDGPAVGPGLELGSEAVRYERADRTQGTRVRAVPAARWPIQRPGWFLRPRLAIDHTSYRLDRVEEDPGRESIDRTLPITSLDAGTIFERPAGRFRQTIEPRAFYVHTPYEDQDDIPLFDTGEFDFSFSQLFRERRFAGGDRIGDNNRLSLALTTRLLDRGNGREVMRAGIGGIHHFADREVQLTAGEPDERSTSDLLAEFAVSPSPVWQGDITVQWDPELEETRRVATRFGFRGRDGGIANLGWRSRRAISGDIEQNQVDGSFAWPVNPRWTLLGRVNHSLEAERNLEALGGVEYRSCCWSVRGIAREYASDNGEETSTSVHIELVLRGLGGVGDDAGGIFERAILGYNDAID